MSADTGGPAFPLSTPEWHEKVSQQGYLDHDFTMGMTLRDYFAAKAMQAFLRNLQPQEVDEPYSTWAGDAYEMADAMLKAREQ